MNLNEVQALYYLLHAVKSDSKKNFDFSLVVRYKNKILTADFLPMNKEMGTISLEEFDYEYDVRKKSSDEFFGKKASVLWKKEMKPDFSSPEKPFERPDLLLEQLVSYTLEKSSQLKDQEPITKIVKNVYFLETKLTLDSMIIDSDDIQVLSLIVNPTFNITEPERN